MVKLGRILRTQEEVDGSTIHYPFTTLGTALLLVGTTLGLVLVISGFEICQAAGACSRSTWSEERWGNFFVASWCESGAANPDRMIGQTMNAYSNFWYSYIGTWILAIAIADFIRNRRRGEWNTPRSHILEAPYLSLSFAFAFWFLGLGSFAYHAYNTSYTVFLDYAGANLLLANMASTTLIQFVSVELDWRFLAFIRVLSVVAATTVGIVFADLSEIINQFWMPPGFVAGTFVFQIIHMGIRMAPQICGCRYSVFAANQVAWQMRQPLLGIASIVVGFIAMVCQEGVFEVPCDPFSAWQFHAAWHALNGSAVGLYYLYVRSEHFDYRSELDSALLAQLEERSSHCRPFTSSVPFLFVSAERKGDALTTKQKIEL